MNAFMRVFLDSYKKRMHYREVARVFHQIADQLETFSQKAEPVRIVKVPYSGCPDVALLCYLERSLANRGLRNVEWDMKNNLLIARQ